MIVIVITIQCNRNRLHCDFVYL